MRNLDYEQAMTLVKKAIEKAKADYGRPICVSICDQSGFLAAFVRMDGSPLRSIQISQRKAYTAVRMGMNTDALNAKLSKENLDLGWYCDELMTALPGGNLLKDCNGTVMGAVGVSGLAPSEDQVITEYIASLVKEM